MDTDFSLKILYVEDEDDIREITRIALSDIGGHDLCVCSSGLEAIQKAQSFNPHIILLDVMMPEMDGTQTLAELKKFPNLIEALFIFMTAKVQNSEVNHLLSLGAVSVISKPFDPIQLPEILRDIWKKNQ